MRAANAPLASVPTVAAPHPFTGVESATSGSKAEMDFSTAMHKRLRIMGTSLRTRSIEEKAMATRLFAQHVVPLFASGAVRAVIDRVFELEEVRAAHERIASNESFGKVVLMIN